MKRPLLCRIGLHKVETGYYVQVKKRRGAHKWHRNYAVCARCGRLVYIMGRKKEAQK